jgi:uncharacterized protein YqjF (DUF2071 family)
MVDHRPWPLPARPWVMRQRWHDLLFAHWPTTPERLLRVLPRGLELDTFDGCAWVSVVPFRMTGVRLRWVPPLPGTSAFPEINVRTYVRVHDTPGVYFFSLDAASRTAVAIARRFHLPYFHARMRLDVHDGVIDYTSRRRATNASPAVFQARYAPNGREFRAQPGTLDHWLTERYCLYAVERCGGIYRVDIHHRPWPLQPARAEIACNTMIPADLIAPGTPPTVQFARTLDVIVWVPARIN